MNRLRLLATATLTLLAAASSASARADLPGEGYRNHLVFSIGAGIGSLGLSNYNSYVDYFNTVQAPAQGNVLVGPAAHPSSELHVPLLATYYGPYYILARTGVETAFFFPNETLSGGDTVTDYGGIIEVPILLGGHYALLDNRLIVELGMGVGIAAFASAGLSGSTGATGVQLFADPSVGFDSELKLQYFLSPGFSLGLELGYRSLTTNALHKAGDSTPYTPDGQDIKLDMSGWRGVFELGFLAI